MLKRYITAYEPTQLKQVCCFHFFDEFFPTENIPSVVQEFQANGI